MSSNVAVGDIILADHQNAAWTSYTPTLASSGSQPTLGNSTLAARYRLTGTSLDITISLQIGSTFSAGSGTYEFSFPSGVVAVAHRRAIGTAYVFDTSVPAHYSGVAFLKSTGDDIQVVLGTTLLAATAPITWATGDEIRIGVRCEVL